MNERYIKIQQGRVSRFESATVTEVNGGTAPGGPSGKASTSTSNRAADRTSVGALTGSTFYPQDRVLMLAGGDNDAPVMLGKNPYIF